MLTCRERKLSAVGICVRSSRAGQGKLADKAGLSECSRQQGPNTAHGILLQWVWALHSQAAAVLPIYVPVIAVVPLALADNQSQP